MSAGIVAEFVWWANNLTAQDEGEDAGEEGEAGEEEGEGEY